jgi:hypothetical protein
MSGAQDSTREARDASTLRWWAAVLNAIGSGLWVGLFASKGWPIAIGLAVFHALISVNSSVSS